LPFFWLGIKETDGWGINLSILECKVL